ncbi:MAG: AAA family ATPase, partial [Planctomycetota bacterium]
TLPIILRDRDQILVAAWALPNKGPLSSSQRRRAMQNFASYIRRNGLTPADVGRQLGSPKAITISELIRGVYRSDPDADIRKLNMWVEQHARQRAAALTDKFVTTKVAKNMLTVARLCRENQTIALALGPTGIGKTRCAQAIHETYAGSIYLRIITGYHHPKGLACAIAEQIGVRGMNAQTIDRHHQFQVERVIDTLRDSNRLLIIDEAHQLSDAALTLLRDMHDTTGIPMLLIATKDLHDRILATVDADRGQLYSRADIVHHLTQGKDLYADGKPLFTVEEIKELYHQAPVRLFSDAVRYLQGVANELGRGSLRRCRILLRNAARRARKRQGLGEDDKVTVVADDLEWVEAHLRQEASEQDAVMARRKRAATVARR